MISALAGKVGGPRKLGVFTIFDFYLWIKGDIIKFRKSKFLIFILSWIIVVKNKLLFLRFTF